MLTLRHTVSFAIQVEVHNQNQAKVTALALEITLFTLGFLYDWWFSFMDWWNDPANNQWPEIHLPDLSVASQVAVILVVSVLFGIGVKL